MTIMKKNYTEYYGYDVLEFLKSIGKEEKFNNLGKEVKIWSMEGPIIGFYSKPLENGYVVYDPNIGIAFHVSFSNKELEIC